ncbi:hypothetical protein [Parabacteroides gordonii]|uniref:hypothetical protein n=1 Tax=Parabacteroides gordonii TaxID=574930 RepID=UPI000ED856DE|nr:hypothetical protein [Parabacteroides gordonii]RGP13097.1 hypothetical protein DXB27_19355 [Parabacteroides gordonii]
MNTFKPIFVTLVLFFFQAFFLACGDDKEDAIVPPDNSITGQEFGIRQLSVKLPRLGRLEILFSKVNCRIHMKGVDDRITYPINTFLSATADPVAIACGKNFYDIICAGLTTGNDLKGYYFELTENINFQMPGITIDKGWEPAGRHNINGSSTSFNGVLDGNGNAIDLLASSSSEDYAGLFYKLGSQAHLHDIKFTSVMLAGKDYIGTAACFSEEGAGGSFTNCYVGGSIEGYNYTGGITGEAGGSFTGCQVGATLSYNSYAFPWEVFLEQPMVTALHVKIKGHDYVGGLVGYSKELI